MCVISLLAFALMSHFQDFLLKNPYRRPEATLQPLNTYQTVWMSGLRTSAALTETIVRQTVEREFKLDSVLSVDLVPEFGLIHSLIEDKQMLKEDLQFYLNEYTRTGKRKVRVKTEKKKEKQLLFPFSLSLSLSLLDAHLWLFRS
jgi:hypothetical protein